MASNLSSYSPLNSQSAQIRVLHLYPSRTFDERLSISLEIVSLNDHPAYSALSYTWGKNADSKLILLGGGEFHILAGLEMALRHLRDTDSIRTLWVDALCIDQGNIAEKQVQIPLMKEIYSTASRVLVWLGESNASINECAHQIAYPYTRLQDEDQIIHRLLSYRGIVLNPWWFRIWVVQEFILAREDPLFLCGHHKWPWSQLRSHVIDNFDHCRNKFSNEEIATRINKLGRNLDLDTKKATDMMKGYAEISALNDMKIQYDAHGSFPLQSVLIHTLRREAKIHQDRLFGIAGLLSDDERCRVRIDYNVPLKRVYLDTMMAFWNDGSVMHLMSAFGFFNYEQDSNIPSWVLNFSRRHPAAIHFVPSEHFPDLWKRNIRLNRPIDRAGQLTLKWPGRLVDHITSCHCILASTQVDPKILAASLCSIRDSMEAASSRRSSRHSFPETECFNVAISDIFGERDNFTALLTNQSTSSQQDARIRRYIDMEWFADVVAAVNPYTANKDALVRVLGRVHEITCFEQTWSDILGFIKLLLKYAIGLKIFTSKQGHIGITSEDIELGDCIVLLDGYELPMVLRKTIGEAFRIVGFSYMPGLVVPTRFEWLLAGKGFDDHVFYIH